MWQGSLYSEIVKLGGKKDSAGQGVLIFKDHEKAVF